MQPVTSIKQMRWSHTQTERAYNVPFCGFPWVETSTAGRVYDLCVYYMTGAPEGSPKVVLCGFMVFMEKPGIEPATPGLQGIALIHYTTGASLAYNVPVMTNYIMNLIYLYTHALYVSQINRVLKVEKNTCDNSKLFSRLDLFLIYK